VCVKRFQAAVKVVEPRLARRCAKDPVFGALPPTVAQIGAIAAVTGQRFGLGISEFHLPPEQDDVAQAVLMNIADLVLRIDQMIAGIDPAVVLQSHGLAAVFSVNAHLGPEP